MRHDERVANVTFGHEAIPERREPSLGEPRQIRLSIGMVPEHCGPEVILDPSPALKTNDREQIAAVRNQRRIFRNRFR